MGVSSPTLRGHCRCHHTGIVLVSLPMSRWLCPCHIGVVAVIALALSPSLHWRTGVIAVVAFASLPPLRCRHRHCMDMGGRCWHCTDAVALASTPSHGRHCQWCTGAIAIILLASCWRFFQRRHHGWRHCRPCTGVVTVVLALTPLLGIIANVVHALLTSSPPSKTGLTPHLVWAQ
jgi:hypothetical protein